MLDIQILVDFAHESNRIEGINSLALDVPHGYALGQLLSVDRMLTVADVDEFVRTIQPDASFRSLPGLDVYVGNHRPIPGGPRVMAEMVQLLLEINNNLYHPFGTHKMYETLHPYTDGNGRSGRALWLWQMHKYHGYKAERLFLWQWYYQSLDNSR